MELRRKRTATDAKNTKRQKNVDDDVTRPKGSKVSDSRRVRKRTYQDAKPKEKVDGDAEEGEKAKRSTRKQTAKEVAGSKGNEAAEAKGKKVAEAKGREVAESKGRELAEAKGKKVAEAMGKEVAESKGREVAEAKGREVAESKGRDIAEAKGKEIAESKGREVAESKGREVTEAKAKVAEARGKVTESKRRDVAEAKAKEVADSKGKVAEAKGSEVAEAKGSEVAEAKGKVAEAKGKVAESKGKVAEAKGKVTESKRREVAEPKGREVAESKGKEVAEAKGKRVKKPKQKVDNVKKTRKRTNDGKNVNGISSRTVPAQIETVNNATRTIPRTIIVPVTWPQTIYGNNPNPFQADVESVPIYHLHTGTNNTEDLFSFLPSPTKRLIDALPRPSTSSSSNSAKRKLLPPPPPIPSPIVYKGSTNHLAHPTVGQMPFITWPSDPPNSIGSGIRLPISSTGTSVSFNLLPNSSFNQTSQGGQN